MRLVTRLIISAGVIFGLAYFSGGTLLTVDGLLAAVWAAVVLGLVNTFIKPVVKLFSLPVTVLTLGLFSLVINMLMLYLVAWIVDGLATVGLWQTFVAALIISIVTSIVNRIIDKND